MFTFILIFFKDRIFLFQLPLQIEKSMYKKKSSLPYFPWAQSYLFDIELLETPPKPFLGIWEWGRGEPLDKLFRRRNRHLILKTVEQEEGPEKVEAVREEKF